MSFNNSSLLLGGLDPDDDPDALDNNGTSGCLNAYCVSEEDYLDSIYEHIVPRPWEWGIVAVYFITFVIGLVGNALVCFAVWRNHNMRTVTNVFIVNLAVGDFLVILICLPPTLVQNITETWFLGTGVCKAILYLQVSSIVVSVLTLSAIAVERWWAICHPLRFKSTLSRARKIIVFIWLTALVWGLPEVTMGEAIPYNYESNITLILLTTCRPRWDSMKQGIYQVIFAVLFYLIPMCLMAFTYSNIGTVLWKKDIPGDYAGGPRNPMLEGSRSSQEEQILSRRKAARMLIAIVLVFGICYLPVHLLNVLRYFRAIRFNKFDTVGPVVTSTIYNWLPYINSSVNPIVYNFMSAKFRKEFKTACFCCFYGFSFRMRPFRPRRDRPFTMTFSNSNYSNCHTEEVTLASV